LWVVLTLVAQLFPLVHMGVVRHDICAEHDALVEQVDGDGGHRRSHGAADDDRDANGDDDGDDDGDDVAAAGDEHDHCELGFLPCVLPAVVGPLVVERVVVLDAPPSPPPRIIVIDALAVAPKQGPPRA
jgi:hypothetical protein